ncbi:IPT/TIG domain-containing protein [Streptomyces sp. NPDC048664]|uniref:IPT/TIG domain-containing protein n=1 Tax=Streptomyces sp. NPDC048664 TaxID=3154505 RepID=UPI00342555F9
MPISPNQGSTAGGTAVTITGVNLAGATSVKFGTKSATITSNTPTMVGVTSPSGTGVVDVTVTTAGGTSNPLSFYYIGPPFLSDLNADSGPTAGGNTVTLTGTGLSTATEVLFGANSATPTVVSDTTLTVTVPAGAAAGSVAVSVTTAGGVAGGLSYVYVDAPTVTQLTPTSGPSTGGTSVTITGTGFNTTQSVTFDGVPAPFAVLSSTTLVAVTPAGSPGAVDVTVTTTGGGATASGGYTYVNSPLV